MIGLNQIFQLHCSKNCDHVIGRVDVFMKSFLKNTSVCDSKEKALILSSNEVIINRQRYKL